MTVFDKITDFESYLSLTFIQSNDWKFGESGILYMYIDENTYNVLRFKFNIKPGDAFRVYSITSQKEFEFHYVPIGGVNAVMFKGKTYDRN